MQRAHTTTNALSQNGIQDSLNIISITFSLLIPVLYRKFAVEYYVRPGTFVYAIGLSKQQIPVERAPADTTQIDLKQTRHRYLVTLDPSIG